MNPIFHLVDWMLREHGSLISGLFIYVTVPLTAWYLGRRSGRKKTKTSHTFVLVIRPPRQCRRECRPSSAGISSRRMTPAALSVTNEKGRERARFSTRPLASSVMQRSSLAFRVSRSITGFGLAPAGRHTFHLFGYS
jgi:hypothetical protein